MVTPQIKQEELHIWCANLRDFDLAVPALWSILSPREQAQAERFRFPRDKDNYIIRHGMLRMLLGAYVGHFPSGLNFTIGPNGKPELRTWFGGGEVYFNLSHSGDVALYGFTGACPIGVDVERVQPIPHYQRIAREFFSQTDADSLKALPEEIQIRRFYDLWTRKEALVKATGDGLGNGQTDRYVPLEDSGFLRLGGPSPTPGAAAEWHVRSFSPREGYVAAVAFQKPDLDLICHSAPAFFSEELWGSGQPALRNQTGT